MLKINAVYSVRTMYVTIWGIHWEEWILSHWEWSIETSIRITDSSRVIDTRLPPRDDQMKTFLEALTFVILHSCAPWKCLYFPSPFFLKRISSSNFWNINHLKFTPLSCKVERKISETKGREKHVQEAGSRSWNLI